MNWLRFFADYLSRNLVGGGSAFIVCISPALSKPRGVASCSTHHTISHWKSVIYHNILQYIADIACFSIYQNRTATEKMRYFRGGLHLSALPPLISDFNLQGGFFDWSALKMTMCQPLEDFSELVIPKNDLEWKKFKYQNWSYSTVGTVQILYFFQWIFTEGWHWELFGTNS